MSAVVCRRGILVKELTCPMQCICLLPPMPGGIVAPDLKGILSLLGIPSCLLDV